MHITLADSLLLRKYSGDTAHVKNLSGDTAHVKNAKMKLPAPKTNFRNLGKFSISWELKGILGGGVKQMGDI